MLCECVRVCVVLRFVFRFASPSSPSSSIYFNSIETNAWTIVVVKAPACRPWRRENQKLNFFSFGIEFEFYVDALCFNYNQIQCFVWMVCWHRCCCRCLRWASTMTGGEQIKRFSAFSIRYSDRHTAELAHTDRTHGRTKFRGRIDRRTICR